MGDTTFAHEYDERMDAIQAALPLDEHDIIETRKYDYHARVRYDPSDGWMSDYYGDYLIDIYSPDRDPPGGRIIYSERHRDPNDDRFWSPILPLYDRAYNIARRLQKDDDLGPCEHCGRLHHDDNTEIVRWKPFGKWDWSKTHDPHHQKTECVGFESIFWPRLHIHTHDDRENPLFDEDELDDCDSLTMAHGYADKDLRTRGEFSLWLLRGELEHAPENFHDDVDLDTLETALDYVLKRDDVDVHDLREYRR